MNYFLSACRLSVGAGNPLMCKWGLRSGRRRGGVNAMTQFDFTGRTGGARVASRITSVTRDGHLFIFFFFFLFFYSYNVLKNLGSDKRIRYFSYFNCSSYFYIE